MHRPIETLTADRFAPFGTLLACEAGDPDGFRVLLEEPEAAGWRMAVNRLTQRSVDRLARHPDTRESFDPTDGVAVIVVAPPASPPDWRAFLLDRPVCLHRNVWHGMFALSAAATVVICENHRVQSEDFPLRSPVSGLTGAP